MRASPIQHYVIAIVIFLFGQAPDLFAFSLGGIDVKSNFGERFHAEIELMSRKGGEIDVSIGTPRDYDRLQINRLDIVDDLRIDGLFGAGEGKKTIKVVSDKPLFFPSFNLVVRASQDGGTLIENYLITVDFQQSVSISGIIEIKKKKRKKPGEVSRPKPADLPGKVKTAAPAVSKAAAAGREAQEIHPPVLPRKSAQPVLSQKSTQPTRQKALYTEEVIQPRSPLPGQAKRPLSVVALPPVPLITPSRPSIALKPALPLLAPRTFTELAAAKFLERRMAAKRKKPKEPEAPTKADHTSETPAVPLSFREKLGATKVYGPLAYGETLLEISRKLEIEPADAVKVSVSIWWDNGDQFVLGNIHGIKKGAVLDLGNLHRRQAQLTSKMARLILKNHWQEWKIIKRKLSSPFEDDEPLPVQEISLPAESNPDRTLIFRLLEGWKQSWENEDIDRHMSYFSRQFRLKNPGRKKFDFMGWRKFKLGMFARHDQVRIRIHHPQLIQMQDRVVASFDQSFDSDKLNSFGHKNVELVYEEAGWKIVSEQFRLKPRGEKETPARFVVHSSSHGDSRSARKAAAQWRKQGFNAYFAHLSLTKSKKIYRVFVERLSEWALAERLAQSLRTRPLGRYAIPVPIPFSLLVGSHRSEDKAVEQTKFLRDRGISSFIFSICDRDFSDPSFEVMVGAYGREEETRWVKRKLAELNTPARLIAP